MICTVSKTESLSRAAFNGTPATFFMNTWIRVDAALQELGADDAIYGEVNRAYFQLRMSGVDQIVRYILRCRCIRQRKTVRGPPAFRQELPRHASPEDVAVAGP